MAGDKWSKWVVGISTVAIFTSFLHLTKDQPESTYDDASQQPDDVPQPVAFNDNIGIVPLSNWQSDNIELFVHSRADMQALKQLSATEKSARAQVLANLDWDTAGGEITIPSTVIKPDQKAQTIKPRSDRRTRRS